MSNNPHSKRDSMMSNINEIDVHQLWSEIVTHRWIIAIVTVVFFLLGAIYAIHKKPQYQTSALVQMNSQNNSISNLTSLASLVSTVTNQQVQASPATIESTLIQSRYVLGPVIEKLGLDIVANKHHWPIFGHFATKDPNAIKVSHLTLPSDWINEKLSIVKQSNTTFNVYDPDNNLIAKGSIGQLVHSKSTPEFSILVQGLKGDAGTRYDIEKLRLDLAMQKIQQALLINTNNTTGYANSDTGIISLTFSGYSPTYVVTVLNTILETAYTLGVQQQSAEAQKIISFLGKQIPQVKAQLQKAEDVLSAYQTKTGNLGIDAQAQVLLQQIVAVNQQLEQLKLQRTELLQKYTAEHPFVITLDDKIKVIQHELNGLNARVKNLPESDKTAVSLLRDVKTKNQLYLTLLSKQEEMQVLSAGVISNMKILDTAYVPPKILPAHKPIILLVSIILGLLFSVAGIVLKMLFRTGVMDPDIIEEQFGLPVAGIIPHSKKQDKISKTLKQATNTEAHILAKEHPDDISVEALRSLRTSLQIAMNDNSKSHVLCISGLTPGIGKSFVSLNLAYAIAQTGKEVLLIDADIRKGKIHTSFAIPAAPGLTEHLTGDKNITQAKIYAFDDLKNLHFLPRGHGVKNPSELLQTKNLKQILDSLRQDYPIIIIDTPPILAVSDPINIMKLADINMLLLSAGQHSMREISQAMNLLRVNDIKVNSCIFNFASISSTSSYYYYTGYSYKNYESYASE